MTVMWSLEKSAVATCTWTTWPTSARKPGERRDRACLLKSTTRFKIEDLLKGVIIQSGNDASVALAEHVAGSEDTFAEMMNQHAARLGMTNTHFMNSDGLPIADHYTTARDLATLTTALIRNFLITINGFRKKNLPITKSPSKTVTCCSDVMTRLTGLRPDLPMMPAIAW